MSCFVAIATVDFLMFDVTLQRAKREHCDFVSLKRFAGGEMEQVGEVFRGGFDYCLSALHPASQFFPKRGAILLVKEKRISADWFRCILTIWTDGPTKHLHW